MHIQKDILHNPIMRMPLSIGLLPGLLWIGLILSMRIRIMDSEVPFQLRALADEGLEGNLITYLHAWHGQVYAAGINGLFVKPDSAFWKSPVE